jgi:protein-tyrosine phosphatase
LSQAAEQPIVSPERLIPLQGGRNFRDLGGYRTRDGRTVKWGLLFRSGSMTKLTQEDWDSLCARGVRAVCDLRTTHERDREPFAWAAAPGLAYFARDYVSSFGELRKVMAAQLPSGEAARAAMVDGFRELPFEQAPAYRQLFGFLAENQLPMIFNCAAGKDRAGTAAALVLSALGVPRATVIEDFVLTDTHGRLREVMLRRPEDVSILSRQPPEVVDAILRANPDYIDAALTAVEQRHGSIEAYLADVLNVDEAALRGIRRNLLD